MKATLKVRRQQLRKELGRVNRQIVATQKKLVRLEARLAQPRDQAA